MIALELLRLFRSRRPLLAILSLLLFLGLMLLGFYTYAQTETGGDAEFRYTFENASYFNGLTFALYAFYFGFLLVLPIFAATAATSRVWFDWTPPIDTSVSAPDAIASGTMYSSLRSLLPPNANPELQSSRLAKRSTFPPSASLSLGKASIGVGPKVSG